MSLLTGLTREDLTPLMRKRINDGADGVARPIQVQGFNARIIRGKVALGVQNIKKGRVIHHRAGDRRMAVKKSGLIWFDLV